MNQANKPENEQPPCTRREVALLAQLQEIELVIEESNILHPENSERRLESLRLQRQELRRNLPSAWLERYDKLREQGAPVVKEASGICTGCRLRVPQGDLQRMRNGSAPWLCPNCSRFILLSE